jgi:hypothetical protein
MNGEVEGIRKEVVVAKLRYSLGICLKGLMRTMRSLIRVARIPVEIRTQYLPHTSLLCYRQTSTLGHKMFRLLSLMITI